MLKHYSDTVEALRGRSDLTAKVLASGGSVLVTALGIAKFSDLFPWPPDSNSKIAWLPDWIPWLDDSAVRLAAVGVVGGFALMIITVLLIAYGFWKVNQPIPLRSDLSLSDKKDVTEKEGKEFVEPTYKEVADLNEVESLLAYEARAHRLERIAKWLPSPDNDNVSAEAAVIQTEVLATQTHARLRILRRRAALAVRGPIAIAFYALFAMAAIAFGVGADYLQSQRTDEIAVAKACADARAVDESLKLPAICGEPPSGGQSEETESSAQRIADAKLQLATLLRECVDAAKDNAMEIAACRSIDTAMDALHP